MGNNTDITANGQPVKVSLVFFLTVVGVVFSFCVGFFLSADAEQNNKLAAMDKKIEMKAECKLDKHEFEKYNAAYRQEYETLTNYVNEVRKQAIETDKKVVKILTILEEREKRDGR